MNATIPAQYACLFLQSNSGHHSPTCPLTLSSNRRPTASAQFWEDDRNLLGGRDLERKGTWLGITRTARFALLTNFREADPNRKPGSPSRGELPSNFLQGTKSPLQYLLELQAPVYNGFNLVVGDLSTGEIAYLTNRDDKLPVKLVPGVYGLSNGTLNSVWPKVLCGKDALQVILEDGVAPDMPVPFDAIFTNVLGSKTQVTDDALLPKTGVPLEWERHLSSVFLDPISHQMAGKYGTRSQTVIAVFKNGTAELRERTIDEEGSWTEAQHKFSVDLSRRSSRDRINLEDALASSTDI